MKSEIVQQNPEAKVNGYIGHCQAGSHLYNRQPKRRVRVGAHFNQQGFRAGRRALRRNSGAANMNTYNFTEQARDGSLLMIIAAAYNGRVFWWTSPRIQGSARNRSEIAKVASR